MKYLVMIYNDDTLLGALPVSAQSLVAHGRKPDVRPLLRQAGIAA